MIEVIKKTWNQVMGIALIVVVLLTKFVVPPVFSMVLFQGAIDYVSLSKFIVAGVILLCLVPCKIFNKHDHRWIWWSLALASFLAGTLLYFNYNAFMNQKTAYNKLQKNRQVIGEHLYPVQQKVVDSISKETNLPPTPDNIVENMGQAEECWPIQEIAANSQYIILRYIATYAVFTLFIMFGIQAVYCANKVSPKKQAVQH